MGGEARRKEIRRIHRKHRLFYELLGGAALLAIGILMGALWLEIDILGDDSSDYRMNLITEGLGIAATVFIINRWYTHRTRESLKRRLLREVRERSNDIALNAIGQMRDEGWLTDEDGLLMGEDLSGAELQSAKLRRANLNGATIQANLRGADLSEAELREAILIEANLYEAKLHKANLHKAVMISVDLREANLVKADLTKANMLQAKLKGAHLFETKLMNADLREVNLKATRWLNTVNLEGSILHHMDLHGLDLRNMNLKKADLLVANLRGTNLTGSDLENANLLGAYLERACVRLWEETVELRWTESPNGLESHIIAPTILRDAILPDGTRFPPVPPSEWKVDFFNPFTRFIYPEHPDFQETLAKIKRIRSSWGFAD